MIRSGSFELLEGLLDCSGVETFHSETGLPWKPLQFKLRLEVSALEDEILEMPDAIRSEWSVRRSLRIM